MGNRFRDKVFMLTAVDADEQIQVDVESLVRDIATEVDRIKGIKDDLEAMEAYFRQRAAPFTAAASSCAREKRRLIDGAKATMLEAGNDKMPGTDWRIAITNGQETAEIKEVADSFHHVFYPDYCCVRYEWNIDKIEEALKAGVELPFAELKRVKKLNFYLNKDPKIDGIASPKRPRSPKQLPATGAAGGDPSEPVIAAQGGSPAHQGKPGIRD